MHDIRLAASRQGHVGWAKYDEQFRLKKERYPTSSWGRMIFELCVMLIAQDQGQPPTTALDMESYMGNIYDSANGTRDTTCKDRPEESVSFITYIPRRLRLSRYPV